MELPFCEICLKTGMLCPGCTAKIKDGELSDNDLEIAKELYRLSQENKGLKDVKFKRSIKVGNLIIILIEAGEIGSIIGKGGNVIRGLSKKLNKKIRVIEESKDVKKVAADLLYPAKVYGINIVYMPDGTIIKRLRLGKEFERKLPIAIKSVKEILLLVTGENVDIVFE
ncbi:MAG: KH domain-containing protein [Candidatus Methanofastidiosa archaeon]|nr:KH domain-containing protein [Candidatus Methanofastidiosa archaeon]HOM96195.1 KH domain-containing protein [Methanofastidiosum sp.]HPC80278.1 KH domain-containing protein [Methanofastidiosum sp.]HRS25712.1 KH domain-containing protein [Methanofastidiosum sp.]